MGTERCESGGEEWSGERRELALDRTDSSTAGTPCLRLTSTTPTTEDSDTGNVSPLFPTFNVSDLLST